MPTAFVSGHAGSSQMGSRPACASSNLRSGSSWPFVGLLLTALSAGFELTVPLPRERQCRPTLLLGQSKAIVYDPGDSAEADAGGRRYEAAGVLLFSAARADMKHLAALRLMLHDPLVQSKTAPERLASHFCPDARAGGRATSWRCPGDARQLMTDCTPRRRVLA